MQQTSGEQNDVENARTKQPFFDNRQESVPDASEGTDCGIDQDPEELTKINGSNFKKIKKRIQRIKIRQKYLRNMQNPLCSCGKDEDERDLSNDNVMTASLLNAIDSEAELEDAIRNHHHRQETILQNPKIKVDRCTDCTDLDMCTNGGLKDNSDDRNALLRQYWADGLSEGDKTLALDNPNSLQMEPVCHLSGRCLPVADFQKDGTDIGKYLLFGKQFKVNPEEWPGKIRWTKYKE